jgi:hypothetical protein
MDAKPSEPSGFLRTVPLYNPEDHTFDEYLGAKPKNGHYSVNGGSLGHLLFKVHLMTL